MPTRPCRGRPEVAKRRSVIRSQGVDGLGRIGETTFARHAAGDRALQGAGHFLSDHRRGPARSDPRHLVAGPRTMRAPNPRISSREAAD